MKTVVYTDLEKAAPDIEMHGVAFHDGDAVEVDDSIADKFVGNRFFAIDGKGGPDEDAATGSGGDINKMNIADLRAEAEAREIDHDGLSKAEIREAIQAHEESK